MTRNCWTCDYDTLDPEDPGRRACAHPCRGEYKGAAGDLDDAICRWLDHVGVDSDGMPPAITPPCPGYAPRSRKRMILAILRELALLFLLAGGCVSLMYAIGVAVGVQ